MQQCSMEQFAAVVVVAAAVCLMDSVGARIHLQMTDQERRGVFGSTIDMPDYEVVVPVERLVRRRRFPDEHDFDEIDLATPKKFFRLQLRRRRDVVSSNFTVSTTGAEGVRTEWTGDPDCLYHGVVEGDPNSMVAFSTCSPHGMVGLIQTNNKHLVLVPVPKRLRNSTSSLGSDQHILYDGRHVSEFCPLDYGGLTEPGRPSARLRRQDSDGRLEKTIELAVFVDDVYYAVMAQHYPDDPEGATLDMIFTLVNAVQLIYSQPSLSVHVRFVLVHVHILKSASEGPAKEGGEIKRYLKSFCGWQAKMNRRDRRHWDHALMLTGLDVFLGTPDNKVVIGLSWVSGMCHSKYSCSVNEATNFESVYVISHELGHNLGMQHDGLGNDCDNGTFVMSASLGPGKTTWSSCSDDYLLKFLRNDYSQCMQNSMIPSSDLDYRSKELPGRKYSAERQCVLSFGSKFRPYLTDENPFDDICRELWCANGTVARRAHPALDGTDCFQNKVCFHGVCQAEEEVLQHLNSIYDMDATD